MRESVRRKIELLAENKKILSEGFRWNNDIVITAASLIYAASDCKVDIERLNACREILKSKVDYFSSFRGSAELIFTSKMALSPDPTKYIDDVIGVYNRLHEGRILDSTYMTIAAACAVEAGRKDDISSIIARHNEIMQRTSKTLNLITSDEGFNLVMLLALCNKDVDSIVNDMEQGYQYIRVDHSYAKAAQGLGMILALTEGDTKSKCDKALLINHAICERGKHYGEEYEFLTLGILASLDVDVNEMADEITEASALLGNKKGFGNWTIGPEKRLMFAAMLVAEVLSPDGAENSRSLRSGRSMTLLAAEEVAIVLMTSVMLATRTSSAAV